MFTVITMILSTLYIVAITAEAMTGAISAGRKNMDWFGVMLVASVTAIGGGTVRDIMIGHYPLGWVENPHYLAITAIAGILTVGVSKWVIKYHKLFIHLDALGLAAFSIIGTQVALEHGMNPSICIVAAVVTGVFGGLLRDLMCRQKPLVLHEELYAFVALWVSILYLATIEFALPTTPSIIGCLLFGYSLRMLSVKYHWALPAFKLEAH